MQESEDHSMMHECQFDMCSYMEAQCEEIRKHKWIESEKARRDLSLEAERDWIRMHAANFRKWVIENRLFLRSSNHVSVNNNNQQ